jgi:hypothetical protein
MTSRTLTLRLDDETDASLRVQEEANPDLSTTDVIRDAISSCTSRVYFVRRSDGVVKIGFSGSLFDRLQQLRREYGDLTLEATKPGGREEEKALHLTHKAERLCGEWFRGPGVEAEIANVRARWGLPEVTRAGKATAFRIEGDTMIRVHAHLDRIQARMGEHITITLTDAVRDLIHIGLHAAEHDETKADQ